MERNVDAAGGSEVFHALYAGLSDLLSGTVASNNTSQINIGSNFDIVAVAATPIPEPGFGMLLSAGILGIVWSDLGRRRDSAT